MTLNEDVCLARADAAQSAAAAAKLDNVRERHLNAEKTWRTLADQARRVVQERKRREAQTALATASLDPFYVG